METETIIYESGRMNQWKMELSAGLANLYGLFIYNAVVRGGKAHRKVNRFRIIGRQSDVKLCQYVWDYLLFEITRLADDYVPSRGLRGVNPERESWCLGCVRGFLAKMQAEKNEVMKSATSTALVFIGNKTKEAEQAFLNKTGIKLKPNSYQSKAQISADTYNSGFRKGQTLTVNSGLGASTNNIKKFGE